MEHTRTLSYLLIVALASLAACGGRSHPLGGDGGVPAQDGAVAGADLGLPASGCIIAIRVDDCCQQPMPALVQHVQQDLCLVPWPQSGILSDENIPKECAERWPEQCQYVDCTWGWPRTRVVQAVPGGGCVWASECEDKGDCTLARDARGCCSCHEPYPWSLVNQDKCLVPFGGTAPDGCAKDCGKVMCDACPTPLPYGCVPDGELNICRAVYTK